MGTPRKHQNKKISDYKTAAARRERISKARVRRMPHAAEGEAACADPDNAKLFANVDVDQPARITADAIRRASICEGCVIRADFGWRVTTPTTEGV
ncbi:hypothetical protein ABZ502_17675 [Streptomyces abikoensis]|uniref:hypothetical protein n=1 Tax=Streptomyces abikoensis TaxID=97398 RepID=UPI00340861C6